MATTIPSFVTDILGRVFPPPADELRKSFARQFIPTKELCECDEMLVVMLNSHGHEDIPFCVCDPDLKDLPINFSSDGFCEFTGYDSSEIEGRNCRFLQGKDTKKEDVDRIRASVKNEEPCCVNLLNYRKDGTTFVNEFFLAPLRDSKGKVVYFIGVQCPVSKSGPGQMPQNVGWVYTQGNHA
eukprot:CAMPEP_0198154146 /NCGR_PEP_ID=MMETSP1443-20131203/67458_1 /TAXON_ID=186043 /ORGANISM="Entomoneis sp., Strain CCMP2396" /LENGTH=182 /DNA_ID=CAMNT_0043820753 /DNA_START=102 /DNA_END=650 /DNA_ORIENTATION=-